MYWIIIDRSDNYDNMLVLMKILQAIAEFIYAGETILEGEKPAGDRRDISFLFKTVFSIKEICCNISLRLTLASISRTGAGTGCEILW